MTSHGGWRISCRLPSLVFDKGMVMYIKVTRRIKTIWINKRYSARIASSLTGGIYAFWGLIGTLLPMDEVLPQKMSLWLKCLISVSILMAVWCLCFLVASLTFIGKKRFKVLTVNNGHAVYLQYGNIFSPNEVLDSGKRRNIVIPVNRCFDVHVDNRIVSAQTLHGIALQRLYASGKYSEESLITKIQQLLSRVEYENVSRKDKPEGRCRRYPPGTVAVLPGNENVYYFFWALSTFDANMTASTTMQEFTIAVQKLIEACYEKSAGFPVVMPLVGTGLSRTKTDQQDVLKYLVNAFRLNRAEISCDIHIVVWEDIKEEIAISNI